MHFAVRAESVAVTGRAVAEVVYIAATALAAVVFVYIALVAALLFVVAAIAVAARILQRVELQRQAVCRRDDLANSQTGARAT